MRKIILTYLLLFIVSAIKAQTIEGIITDVNNNFLSSVNISIINKSNGVTSDISGKYKIDTEANRSHVIAFSFIGYQTEKIRIPMLKKGQNYTLNIILQESNIILKDIIVKDQKSRKSNLSRIKTNHVEVIPGSNGGIESILKTLPGVSSANELSSQYSVRGGNFDENLIYVKKINKILFFKNLTLAPIDQDLIDHKLLTKKERNYLFKYHYEVYSKISPFLKKNEKKWLASII